eukprot:12523536-Alexandrium_andersonii.AAC.1
MGFRRVSEGVSERPPREVRGVPRDFRGCAEAVPRSFCEGFQWFRRGSVGVPVVLKDFRCGFEGIPRGCRGSFGEFPKTPRELARAALT